MPPRFAYWTIIVEGKPTAFRAQDRDDLVPTFKQLQSKHPDAVMMWFARGRLWTSPEEARAAERPGGAARRGQDWRPGGAHRDPRARFDIPRDEKRRRFAERMRRDERPGDERPWRPKKPDWTPKPPGAHGDRRPFENRGDRPPREERGDRPPREDRGPRPPRQDEARGDRPWQPKKPGWKPGPGDRRAGPSGPANRGDRRPFENRGDRPPREDRGPRPPRQDETRGDRPWQPKKPGWKPGPGDRRAGPSGPANRSDRRPFESRGDRPPREDRGPRPPRQDENRGDRPWRPKKPDWKPKPPGARGPKPEWKPRPPGARGPKPEWKPRPPGAHGPKSGGGQGRPSGFRPRGPGGRGPGGRGPGGRGQGGKPPGRGGRGGGGSR
jgi:23S rRNA pseudouridine2605 synthase